MDEEDILQRSYRLGIPLSPPKDAYLNVVKRCNARCGYCSDWQAPRDSRLDPSRSQLSDILLQFKSLGITRVLVSGGEPFLRRDLLDIIREVIALGFEARLITNGSVIRSDDIESIAGSGITKIGVSIDSLDPAKMLAIRGLPVQRVRQTIEHLAAVRAKYGQLIVSLYVTVTKLNVGDLIPLADYAEGLNISVQYQPVNPAETGMEENISANLWPGDAEITELAVVMQELVARKQRGASIISRVEFLRMMPRYFRQGTYHPDQCTVAYTDVVVDQDLNVRPCWSMEPVGSLALPGGSLLDIWRSEAMRQARETIRDGNCPGCLYSCHINKPIIKLG